jgi:hypothetical protein
MQNNLLSLDMYTGVTPSVAEMHKPGIQAGSRALEKVLQQMLQRVTRVTRGRRCGCDLLIRRLFHVTRVTRCNTPCNIEKLGNIAGCARL